ncbi:MAG: two-component system sensor histidine kinase FlrB [Enterobacterales bacterium]|jgi:two-component system sensor histidine kinase FlrB
MTSGTQPVWNTEITSGALSPILSHGNMAEKQQTHTQKDDSLDKQTDTKTANEVNNKALSQFSDISRKFIDSYTHLEQHIDRLSDELAAQTAEKEQQFEERNRLAERLEGILSTLPSGVVVIDGHGIVQESNALAVDMLGLPIIGETWLNIISRAFAPRSDDGYEISLKDGRRVKVETKALVSEPGQIVLITDLTETRKRQDDHSREQRLSVIGKMMASLAHQIRTPLSSALLYSGHISSQKLDAKRQQRVHMNLQHSLKQLERQVSDMLLFASGGVTSKQRFQLHELSESLQMDIENHVATKDIDIIIDNRLSEELIKNITLFGNMQSLLGAIANLIENSIHACRENKSKSQLVDINVTLDIHDKKTICIAVSDNGCGITEADKNEVFKPFFTRRAKGTGLGLAVVKTVMNSFKGDISINSNSSGTTINLLLPCINTDSFTVEGSTTLNDSQQMAGG